MRRGRSWPGDGSPSVGSTDVVRKQPQEHASIFVLDWVVICMVTTRPPKTIVKPTALGPVANTDTKLLVYGLFQKGRVLAQDDVLVSAPKEEKANLMEWSQGSRYTYRATLRSYGVIMPITADWGCE